MSGDEKKGGGTSKKDEPVIPGTGPMMTQPAFMGDNQSLLAQQLAAGGYGSMPDIMAMLTQTFTPMQVLNTQPGATPAPGIPSTPATQTGDIGGLDLTKEGFGALSGLSKKERQQFLASRANPGFR